LNIPDFIFTKTIPELKQAALCLEFQNLFLTSIPCPRSCKPGKVTGNFPVIEISPIKALAAAR
jgi:hypothetical protein